MRTAAKRGLLVRQAELELQLRVLLADIERRLRLAAGELERWRLELER